MSDRVNTNVFTKEMKETHTLLFPNMLTTHFMILRNILQSYGFKIEVLQNDGPQVVEEGLRYVHNDTCYPALLTIGQMIDALKSGKYDVEHVALLMSQTGGGCRASNYAYLLRKALRDAGLGHVPVVTINLSTLENNPGFRLTIPMLRRMLAALAYGDMLMLLSNQVRPYEVHPGQTDALVRSWVERTSGWFDANTGFSLKQVGKHYREMVHEFGSIEQKDVPKVKVGIVGEIYAKYSPLANNGLEKFLAGEGCEVMVPGIMQFLLYAIDMPMEDTHLYGGSKFSQQATLVMFSYLTRFETELISAVQEDGTFTAPSSYAHLKEMVTSFIGNGCKMGEGWLLTAEMIELTESGYGNIVCAQPFGCLPNHIVGKGMMSAIRKAYPQANIVAIDYDPGATKVNQENRIKLMLSIARENLEKEK